MNTTSALTGWRYEAYFEGYRSGQSDRFIGYKSEYAWLGADLDRYDSYSYWYSRGYRQGWN